MKNKTEKTILNLRKEKISSFKLLKLVGGTGTREITTGRTQTKEGDTD